MKTHLSGTIGVKPVLFILSVFCASCLLITLTTGKVFAGDTPIKEEAKVYFIWPKNGQVIKGGKLWVRLGLRNAGVAPAGVAGENTGHHHLIIDRDLPPLDEEIPADRNHFHMGKGQTEYRLRLPPGKHTMQILFADHDHIPHNPPIYSKKITITVVDK